MPLEFAAQLWPAIAAHLARACARSGGRYEPSYLISEIAAERMSLWVAISKGEAPRVAGVAVVHLNDYPTGLRALQVIAASGLQVTRPADVALIVGVLRAYARAYRCRVIEWSGRAGFTRLAARFGAANIAVVAEMEI